MQQCTWESMASGASPFDVLKYEVSVICMLLAAQFINAWKYFFDLQFTDRPRYIRTVVNCEWNGRAKSGYSIMFESQELMYHAHFLSIHKLYCIYISNEMLKKTLKCDTRALDQETLCMYKSDEHVIVVPSSLAIHCVHTILRANRCLLYIREYWRAWIKYNWIFFHYIAEYFIWINVWWDLSLFLSSLSSALNGKQFRARSSSVECRMSYPFCLGFSLLNESANRPTTIDHHTGDWMRFNWDNFHN